MAVVLVFQRVADELIELPLEFGQTGRAGKRLIVTEKREHDVRFGPLEPIVWAAEVLAAHPDREFVTSESQIPDSQVAVGKMSLEQRLEPPIVLHSIRQRVADD